MKHDKPEWYPAQIHKKKLTLEEWRDILKLRVYAKWLLKYDRENYTKNTLKIMFMRMINGKIDVSDSPFENSPIRLMPFKLVDEESSTFRVDDFDLNWRLSIPFLVCMDFKDTEIIEAFKQHLTNYRTAVKKGILPHNAGLLNESEYGKEVKLSQEANGRSAYTEHNAGEWFVFKVLDYIDLKIWEDISEIKYEKEQLVSWIRKAGYDKADIDKVIEPKANELVSELAIRRISRDCL